MNGNGFRLPAWAVGIIIGMIVQLLGFAAGVAVLKNEVSHLCKTTDEIRFRMAGMNDGDTELRERLIRIETRLDRLEDD